MSDSTYGLDGSGDGWTASYDSPTDPPKKEQPLAAAASASPTDTSSSSPSYMNGGTPASTTPAASTSLYSPAPASTPAASPASPAMTGPDPVAADQHARSIYSSLQEAGHDVKWVDNKLMVDGRPYDVSGGSPGSAAPGDVGYIAGTANDPAVIAAINQSLAAANPSYIGIPATKPTGGSTTKPTGGNMRDPTYAAQFVAYYANQPGANPSLKNDPNYWIGKLTSGELGSDENWIINKMMQPEGAPAGASGGNFAALSTFTPPPLAAAQGFTAPSLNVPTIDPGLVPSYAKVSSIGDPSALSPNIDMPSAPWGDSGIPTYQPGAITSNDIPDFTPESLRAQMNSGGASSSLDALIKSIEDNPTSLDDHTVDTMKAQMKDTLAEQGQLNDDYTKSQAGALGIGDSPWLASERASARRSTGQAIAAGGQNIDIEAGKTRQAQKLASAATGQAYQANRDKQVMDTVSAGLNRATVTGDRMALRESVAQAAAKSKQDAFSIQAQWLEQQTGFKISAAQLKQQGQEFAENLMMQIAQANVGVASKNADISQFNASYNMQAAQEAARQAEAARQFNATYGMTGAQFGANLGLNANEFGATYGLNAAQMQHNFDNDAWNHSYLDSNNLGPTA